MMHLVARARSLASRCLLPLVRRAAKAYIAGERLDDATRMSTTLDERGLAVTLGYWDAPNEPPRQVADEYLAGVAALAELEHGYLSIKVPSLGFSEDLLERNRGRSRGGIRCDCTSTRWRAEMAERSRALCDHFLDRGAELSYTLPGRWLRSVDDAEWAVRRGIVVRVVKGQWPDADDPRRDLRQGFLQVIDALAGRARHVAVASHDTPLVVEAVRRLQEAGTSCELELLHGLPMGPSLELADRLELGVRVYVPYGKAYLPYALSRVRDNPRILWWLMRDFLSTQSAAHERCVAPAVSSHTIR